MASFNEPNTVPAENVHTQFSEVILAGKRRNEIPPKAFAA